ncbi:hypothetical protein MES5069_740046 [Mesorhizobium escarrei]|uniref:Uncharacterized protein n=1 Tax=Mesorhizobium escarrei TaxID=666018 RepID=A0ABN8KGJ8_9HYPH|nr:hypothetical protein MES5069_740046 [Mesorhizobium escarrei]
MLISHCYRPFGHPKGGAISNYCNSYFFIFADKRLY